VSLILQKCKHFIIFLCGNWSWLVLLFLRVVFSVKCTAPLYYAYHQLPTDKAGATWIYFLGLHYQLVYLYVFRNGRFDWLTGMSEILCALLFLLLREYDPFDHVLQRIKWNSPISLLSHPKVRNKFSFPLTIYLTVWNTLSFHLQWTGNAHLMTS
jgi:hypothetical protein